jgi:PAS domain S-box-containing protein
MSGHSETDWTDLRQRVLGMGKASLHKSHYASLRQRMAELERFRSLIDAASDLLFIVDVPSGRILDVNESACRRLAMAPGEIKDASFERLIAAPGWEQLTETWKRSPEVPDAVVVSEFRTADGKEFPVEIAVRVLRAGRGCHGILAARDISERTRAEQQRANLEEELRQAQRLESLGRLAGGVAHDFNNLLTVITGYSSLLLSGLRTGLSAEKCAAEIHEAAESAARLTRQLLDVGRKQIVRPASLDMNTLIAETSGMLQRLLGEDVVFTTRLAPGLDSVLVDRDQMQHVLINLCVNGRDAMPQGGQLTVETRNVEMDEKGAAGHPDAVPGRYVLMSVSDTGVGMDEAWPAPTASCGRPMASSG